MSINILPGHLVVGMKSYTDANGNMQYNHVSLSSIFVVIDLQNLYNQNPTLYKTPKAKEGHTPVIPALIIGNATWKGKILNKNAVYYELPTSELAVINPFHSELPHFSPYVYLPDSFNTQILDDLQEMEQELPELKPESKHENTEFEQKITTLVEDVNDSVENE